MQDEGGAGGGLQLAFVAAVILRERLPAFERCCEVGIEEELNK